MKNCLIHNILNNVVSGSEKENNFPHQFLLTDKHVSRRCKDFVNNSLASIKLSKVLLFKMVQLGGVVLPLHLFHLYELGKPFGESIEKNKICPKLKKNIVKLLLDT